MLYMCMNTIGVHRRSCSNTFLFTEPEVNSLYLIEKLTLEIYYNGTKGLDIYFV
jgi:hypothetical protein